ncbi:MAG: DNA (cytosine-5-)-methyltransferase [Mycetocola sp.]
MKIGSLFSGVAGLDRAVESFFDAEVAWFVEFDAAPSKVLAHHYPGVPNYGDVTTVDWANVEPIDILTGGFPCQDVSLAGARRGLRDGTRSGLWSEYAKAIDILRPKLVVIENVRGLLSAQTIEEVDASDSELEPGTGGMGEPTWGDRPVLNAFGRVLGDLAELGYDAEWVGLRAADAGAPHNRYRVFIVAQDANLPTGDQWWQSASRQAESGRTRAGAGGRSGAPAQAGNGNVSNSTPWWAADDTAPTHASRIGGNESYCPPRLGGEGADRASVADEHSSRPGGTEWGIYQPAITRWEDTIGRVAPPATNPDGRDGSHRLSAEFVTWMMGWPQGWVTDPAIGLTRNEQLKACGNGVVTQQAYLALSVLMGRAA